MQVVFETIKIGASFTSSCTRNDMLLLFSGTFENNAINSDEGINEHICFNVGWNI